MRLSIVVLFMLASARAVEVTDEVTHETIQSVPEDSKELPKDIDNNLPDQEQDELAEVLNSFDLDDDVD